jgi:hypothetical protein
MDCDIFIDIIMCTSSTWFSILKLLHDFLSIYLELSNKYTVSKLKWSLWYLLLSINFMKNLMFKPYWYSKNNFSKRFLQTVIDRLWGWRLWIVIYFIDIVMCTSSAWFFVLKLLHDFLSICLELCDKYTVSKLKWPLWYLLLSINLMENLMSNLIEILKTIS